MYKEECIPFAPSLIESMRSLGYSFPSAIADLLDNSIGAGAKNIDIIAEPSNNPSLVILDDGCGMTKDVLSNAMRYGSTNPLEKRSEEDLGRFGLGLKSASMSQCRTLVVISKVNDDLNALSWDLDYVIAQGDWILKGYEYNEILNLPHVDKLLQYETGTIVYLSNFDKLIEGASKISETFNNALNDMSDHIALIFHRYIQDGLKINVNYNPIEPRDPFLYNHPSTQKKRDT